MKPTELTQPYKTVKRRGVKEAPTAAQEDPEPLQEESVVPVPDALVTKMFGLWQTQAWVAPTAVGGVVPKNDRGNVHCPPFASELPKVSLQAMWRSGSSAVDRYQCICPTWHSLLVQILQIKFDLTATACENDKQHTELDAQT